MIRYLPFVSTAGGGGGGGGVLTWYYGLVVNAGGAMPAEPNTAATQRNDFVSHMGSGVTCENFEDNGTWTNGVDLEGATITRNGVGMTISNDFNAIATNDTTNSRFNTSPSPVTSIYMLFSLENYTFYNELTLSFSPAISAWGAYITDMGDFAEGGARIELTKSGGGTEIYNFTTTAVNGSLMFLGFIDFGTTTYTSLRIFLPNTTSSNEVDGVGMDDIYWCKAADIV